MAAAVLEAINIEDEDKVTDFRELAKTSKTINMDPRRFECVLGDTSLKQPNQKRLYLQALPYYIEEREERIRAMKEQQMMSEETEDSDVKEAVARLGRCPPRKVDNALDPEL